MGSPISDISDHWKVELERPAGISATTLHVWNFQEKKDTSYGSKRQQKRTLLKGPPSISATFTLAVHFCIEQRCCTWHRFFWPSMPHGIMAPPLGIQPSSWPSARDLWRSGCFRPGDCPWEATNQRLENRDIPTAIKGWLVVDLALKNDGVSPLGS